MSLLLNFFFTGLLCQQENMCNKCADKNSSANAIHQAHWTKVDKPSSILSYNKGSNLKHDSNKELISNNVRTLKSGRCSSGSCETSYRSFSSSKHVMAPARVPHAICSPCRFKGFQHIYPTKQKPGNKKWTV